MSAANQYEVGRRDLTLDCAMTSNRVDSEIDMDWVYPWVGLGWVGSVG